MAVSRVVSEIFDVDKYHDLEIGVGGHWYSMRVRWKFQDSPDRPDCNLFVRLFVSDQSDKSDRLSFILSGLSCDVSERSMSRLRPFWHTRTWRSVQHGGSH